MEDSVHDERSITFFICGNDIASLETEKAGFKGWQAFLDVKGTFLSPSFLLLTSTFLARFVS